MRNVPVISIGIAYRFILKSMEYYVLFVFLSRDLAKRRKQIKALVNVGKSVNFFTLKCFILLQSAGK